MTIKEFIDDFAKIQLIEDDNEYGHFPFQLLVKTKQKTVELNALAVSSVVDCYARAKVYMGNNPEELFLSLDFPPIGDIYKDFVCVITYKETKYTILAIPYDRKTGNTFDVIMESDILDKILSQFKEATS